MLLLVAAVSRWLVLLLSLLLSAAGPVPVSKVSRRLTAPSPAQTGDGFHPFRAMPIGRHGVIVGLVVDCRLGSRPRP